MTDWTVLGGQLWEAIIILYVEWDNANRLDDVGNAEIVEQVLRFFSLVYASLMVDGVAVSTERKAIIRSMYAGFGGSDTANVHTMLDAVIRREEVVV